MAVQQIGERAWYLSEGEAVVTVGAAIPFNNNDVQSGTVVTVSGEGKQSARIRQWGKKDTMPQLREGLVNESNIVPALIQTNRDMILGAGLMAFREEFTDG